MKILTDMRERLSLGHPQNTGRDGITSGPGDSFGWCDALFFCREASGDSGDGIKTVL